MSNTRKLSRAALVSAIALAFSAPTFAQTSGSPAGDSGGQTKAGATATTGTTSATTRGAPDNTNSKVRTGADVNTWAKGYAGEHQGRISRQAYMDEMARRWDSMDRKNQGLTPAEVSRLTGKVDVDHAAPPRTGSDVQAGDMGPSSTRGK